MRKFTLLFAALVLVAFAVKAQTICTFEGLTLPGLDTAYVNYTSSGNDVGFTNGNVYYPCVYDTAYGGYWSYGFSYSNETDSVTSGLAGQYASKTVGGYGGSAKYAVAYGTSNSVKLQGLAAGHPVQGFYITNNTYAFNSMRDGDSYARKFGDTTGTGITTGQGTAPDYYKLQIRGYKTGVLQSDSVDFYLADFRFAHSDSDYIVNTWKWVDLLPLGNVDSVTFALTSTDNSFGFMNTPAYFCIDNFTTNDAPESVATTQAIAAKVYPNPATNLLNIDFTDNNMQVASIVDMKGNTVYTQQVTTQHVEINTSSLAAGTYILRLIGNGVATTRFIKE